MKKTPESAHLRSVFGKFATGVTVVTFRQGESVSGMTVNSFSSVSLHPPKVLFCPSLHCRFTEAVEVGGLFTISILAHDQKDVCLHFAGRPCLDVPPWTDSGDYPPVVEGSLAHIRCELEAMHRHGDHFVAVGRVLSSEVTSQEAPLMFYSGHYPQMAEKVPE